MYVHYFLYLSSVGGHPGFFRILAIMNNVAVNMGMEVSIWGSVFSFLGYIPRSGIAGSYMVILYWSFWGTSILFSTASPLFYISTNRVQEFHFLRFLTNTIIIIIDRNYPNGYEVILWFWFAFPQWLIILNTLSHACWPFVCFYGLNVYVFPKIHILKP